MGLVISTPFPVIVKRSAVRFVLWNFIYIYKHLIVMQLFLIAGCSFSSGMNVMTSGPITSTDYGLSQLSSINEPFEDNDRYQALRKLYAEYLQIKKLGGWPLVSTPCPYRELVSRLKLSRDFNEKHPSRRVLRLALQEFQNRHGLPLTGTCDERTLSALNASIESRIRQIEANLKRWLNFSSFATEQYIEVNVASRQLTLYRNGAAVKSLRVIVGKRSQPTPILQSYITELDINPFWEIPLSIASHEIFPYLKRDNHYLEKHHMQLFTLDGRQVNPASINWNHVSPESFRYHVHQLPGPWNALGNMKFTFPNHFGVYLHGTANPELFREDERYLSHGCIRAEDPLFIAEVLLEGTSWTRDAIQEAVTSGVTKKIILPKPVPIYLSYWTAWVDEKGLPHFSSDPYDLDENGP